MTNVSAKTRLFLLLGDPVAHSLSPAFQNAAMRAAGIDAAYLALPCAAASVPHLMAALAAAGGGGNVTVPHKHVAATTLDRPSPAVMRTGACNTFWGEDGRLCGDNTDVAGFRAAALGLVPDLAGARVALIGAGGAAAAALAVLLDEGAGVLLVNRTRERAEELARHVVRAGPAAGKVKVGEDVLSLDGGTFDLVINATRLGLADADPLPVDLRDLRDVGAALDLVSRPDGDTPWVRHARDIGVTAADGLEMLLHQGAAAFRCWFDREPPMDAMTAAVRRTGVG